VLTPSAYTIERAPNQRIRFMTRNTSAVDLPGVASFSFGLETAESNAPAITDLDLRTGTPFDDRALRSTVGTDAPNRRVRTVSNFVGAAFVPFTITAESTILAATVTFDASSAPLDTYRFTVPSVSGGFYRTLNEDGFSFNPTTYGNWAGQEISVRVVPEPGESVLLTVLGCGVLVLIRRVRKARAA